MLQLPAEIICLSTLFLAAMLCALSHFAAGAHTSKPACIMPFFFDM